MTINETAQARIDDSMQELLKYASTPLWEAYKEDVMTKVDYWAELERRAYEHYLNMQLMREAAEIHAGLYGDVEMDGKFPPESATPPAPHTPDYDPFYKKEDSNVKAI